MVDGIGLFFTMFTIGMVVRLSLASGLFGRLVVLLLIAAVYV